MNKIENKKEQIKEFVNNHKADIKIIGASILIGTAYGLGCACGIKYEKRRIAIGIEMVSLAEPEFDIVFDRGIKKVKEKFK